MTSTAEAHAQDALERFLRASGGAQAALAAAFAADSGCVPAHLLRIASAVTAKDRAALARLDDSVALLGARAASLDERERMHLAAARAWRAGAHEVAAHIYSGIAQRSPHDLLAIRLAQSSWFMLGRPRELHEVAARALPHWHDDLPAADALLAMHAFGLEATGDLARAEAAARQAIALFPRNPSAIHAVAHALEGRGAIAAGLRWMEQHAREWTAAGGMASHNAWHTARFHLALGQPQRALALYDRAVAPALDHVGSDAADAAALLWRFGLDGVDVGKRWEPVAAAFALRPLPSLWALADVHAGMAFAAAGRGRELDRLRSALAAAPGAAHRVAFTLLDGIEAFAAGERASAHALLAPRLRDTWRLGGSRAQREIVALTCAVARHGAAFSRAA